MIKDIEYILRDGCGNLITQKKTAAGEAVLATC